MRMPQGRRETHRWISASHRPLLAACQVSVLLLGLTLTVGPSLRAEVSRADVRVLRGFTLIDGTGRAPAPNSAMVVDAGRITWIGPASSLKAPAGAEVVDLTGRFVMPGMIDLHGHFGITVGMTQDASKYSRQIVEHDLKTYASYGVTTVLSLGLDSDLIFELRDQQRASRPTMTRVYTAGQG